MSARIVKCAKYGQELAGLDAPPFPGALGQRIFDGVSHKAWDDWQERSVELMKERKWSMGDPAARKALLVEMEKFLLESPVVPEAPEPTADAEVPADMVLCAKIGRVLKRLPKPPFSGALGQRIFDSVSAEGFKLWEAQATIVMNHNNLSMADPEARKFLMKQMEDFFFGLGAQLPADWIPQGAGGGKGGGGKGAPAPRSK